jgi:hypothetical protein
MAGMACGNDNMARAFCANNILFLTIRLTVWPDERRMMQEILNNIDAGVKAGLEKARKANTVEPLVRKQAVLDVIEKVNNEHPLSCDFAEDARYVWPAQWKALCEAIKNMTPEDIVVF